MQINEKNMDDIDIQTPTKEFQKHLNLPDNHRIVFSAKYGLGKTFFLKKFFKNENWFPIFLSPVNYTLASNDDIFSMIKYEILGVLIDEGKLAVKPDGHVSEIDALSAVAKKFVSKLLYNIPTKIRSVITTIKQIEKLGDEYRDEIAKGEPSEDEIRLMEFDNRMNTHFLYEEDFLTNKIQESLEILNGNKLETVLIIDDIDRLDPSHIFRLLNVFSAHLDDGLMSINKYGFSRIIFVCDVENIKKIFEYKYGTGVDFKGYLDKFYCHSVFEFSNQEKIIKKIGEFFDFQSGSISRNRKDIANYHASIAGELVMSLLESNELNIRCIKKIMVVEVKNWPELNSTVRYGRFDPIGPVLNLLSWIIGSKKELKEIFERISQNQKRLKDRGITPTSSFFENRDALMNNVVPFYNKANTNQRHKVLIMNEWYEYECKFNGQYNYAEFIENPSWNDYHVFYLLAAILE